MHTDIALGLDPGRDKTGFAFADEGGSLILSGIFGTDELDKFFEDTSAFTLEGKAESNMFSRVRVIFIGDGTHSKAFTERVRSMKPGIDIVSVDERNTTLEARSLYWKLHRPSFWMRLIPEGLRVPARVLDDLAAWSIALRGLKKYRDISRNKL
ncbi:MAG: endonuclease [Synergistaceae bacterium]|nr:endonuclease [Synergistaceae bacterium]